MKESCQLLQVMRSMANTGGVVGAAIAVQLLTLMLNKVFVLFCVIFIFVIGAVITSSSSSLLHLFGW